MQLGLRESYVRVWNVVPDCSGTSIKQPFPHRIALVALLDDRAKNVSGLLRSTAMLRQLRDDFELHIYGDGPDRESLESAAAELALESVVFFHGLVPPETVREALLTCSFSVNSSNYETFCVALAESLACGKPVVCTRSGGPSEYVTRDVGILVPVGDESGLCSAMNQMLNSLHQYRDADLRSYARMLFGEAAVTDAFDAVYRGVFGQTS